MHLLVRETHGLDEDAPAQELGQTPAPLLGLSFSDADLGALAAAWTPTMPELRLASLARLRHPLSVDLYVEQMVAQARFVLVRLLGGLDYWRYGAEETASVCRVRGIPLALLPGDAADDTRLRELSTVAAGTWTTLDACLRQAGPENTALALRWAAHLAGLGPAPATAPHPTPQHGVLREGRGDGPGRAVIVAYRSHHLSADTAPIEALAQAVEARGVPTTALYVASLKAPETAGWMEQTLRALRPTVILNATNFSARTTGASPLDAAGCPVLQVVLSSAPKPAWERSSRGLSPTDLAMQVVLPELDGRLLSTAISFKAETPRHPVLQHARTVHMPDADGIAHAAAQGAAWSRLATTARPGRRLAITLSNYPHPGQEGHAVGLDTFQSLSVILGVLAGSAYTVRTLDPVALTHALTQADPAPFLSLAGYLPLFATLPPGLQAQIEAAWGAPGQDPTLRAQHFTLRHLHSGAVTIALQPPRGGAARAGYHDPHLPPTHAYVAFHLWLRHVRDIHALVHLGAHGTLEWLPGKAAALSPGCHPQALLGGLPVIYPFIVNNPGEAAAAKRRLGAVTIGHLTPPLATSPHGGPARTVERLLEEYAAADGLDRRRTTLLRQQILEHAGTAGLLDEAAAPHGTAPEDAIARLDAYLCDVKDLQIRDGLHVYGASPAGRTALLQHLPAAAALDASPAAEREALLAALDGRFVEPGPAGAPSRGRADVLPTGRNLTTVDPRTIPTPAALRLAERAADALLRRHRNEHGDWPRTVVLDVWASTTMRTGGEDLALAYLLLGARPLWDDGSGRVCGFEIMPIALLDRPRVDVTLRISGQFRDAFAAQVTQFDALVRAVAARDEAADFNPLAGQHARGALLRVYGPAPGTYGAGDATGAGWRAASSAAYGSGHDGTPDAAGLAARLAGAEAFVHTQDHAEHDLLDSPDWAAHEGGFAAAAKAAGAAPALYHLDTSDPDRPRARTVAEEIARVVRGRAANPAWIAGQMRHAYAGTAEIARPLAALQAFARTLPHRFDRQFDLLYAATLGTPEVEAFLAQANPAAHQDLVTRFDDAQRAGLWHPRSNTRGASSHGGGLGDEACPW